MSRIYMNKMSDKELESLNKRSQEELERRKQLDGKRGEVKAEAQRRLSAIQDEADAKRKAVRAYVKDEGFDFDVLMGKVKKAGSRAPAKPKYQNPNNPAESWTGKGPRPPEWARIYKEQGRLDEIRIKD